MLQSFYLLVLVEKCGRKKENIQCVTQRMLRIVCEMNILNVPCGNYI